MKDPAFLFYPNDYIGGTMGWTFEQKGAYIELLMMQFNRGHMTSHMIGQVLGLNRGHTTSHMGGHTVGQNGGQTGGQTATDLWEILKSKFEQDENGLYFNRRLEEEQNARKAYTASRRNNLSGANQHTKKAKKVVGHMGGHTSSHKENEDIYIKEKAYTSNDINIKPKKTKIEREQEFRLQVKQVGVEKYDEAMLLAFADYWTESNPNGKKMKYEMQSTFDISRRLTTWHENKKNVFTRPQTNTAATFAKGQSNF